MKKLTLVGIVFLIAGSIHLSARESDLQAILQTINQMNRFSDIYTANVQIASFGPDNRKSLSAFKIFVKGLDNVLLQQLYPKKDLNKKILLKNGKTWFYFPKVRKAILINPRNTLFGTVSVGDVMSPPILDLYKYERREEIRVDNRPALRLTFLARDRKSPFGKMVYTYQDSRVITSESYTRSGIFLKEATFGDFVDNGKGSAYASRVKIVNQVNTHYYSLIKISELNKVDNLPDYYFMVEGLDKITD